jgi:hypothetical protein
VQLAAVGDYGVDTANEAKVSSASAAAVLLQHVQCATCTSLRSKHARDCSDYTRLQPSAACMHVARALDGVNALPVYSRHAGSATCM